MATGGLVIAKKGLVVALVMAKKHGSGLVIAKGRLAVAKAGLVVARQWLEGGVVVAR